MKIGKTIKTIKLDDSSYTLERDEHNQWRIFVRCFSYHPSYNYKVRVPGINNELCNLIGNLTVNSDKTSNINVNKVPPPTPEPSEGEPLKKSDDEPMTVRITVKETDEIFFITWDAISGKLSDETYMINEKIRPANTIVNIDEVRKWARDQLPACNL